MKARIVAGLILGLALGLGICAAVGHDTHLPLVRLAWPLWALGGPVMGVAVLLDGAR